MNDPILSIVVLLDHDEAFFGHYEKDPGWWEIKLWLSQDKPYWAVPDSRLGLRIA